MSIPQLLLRRLDELGSVLAGRGDAIALIALGSVGVDLDRLDDHSDLDFFVIVDADAKQRYLDEIDWLEALGPVAFSFANTVDGRKVLFVDGVFAEYAVFSLAELRDASFSPGRIVWCREDAPARLEYPRRVAGTAPTDSVDHQVNEALTNLYVGLQREARGEKLSASRLIQTHAVDRLIVVRGLIAADAPPQQDDFVIERGVEDRFGADGLPLAEMVLGYEHNREAALAILEWLEAHADVDDALAAAVRRLATSPTSPADPIDT
jgi:hypothetical protein